MRETDLLAAHALADEGDLDAAAALGAELLNEDPHDGKALSVCAYAHMKAERYGLGYALLQKANRLWPERTEILNNLGMCAMGCMLWDEAERHLKAALKVDPGNVAALNNMVLVCVNACEPDRAIAWGEQARKASGGKTDPALEESLGYAHLMLGHWREGWEGYEGGLHGKIRRPRSYGGEPYWDGRPVDTLVVRGEQGIGDEISFASVLPDAKQHAKRVIVDCDRRLLGLFRRSFPDLEVYGTRFQQIVPWAEGHDFDAHVLIGSLCQYYRNEAAAFPGTPFLVADPERRAKWRERLDRMPGRKIGIAWNGGRHNTHRERRSIPLAELAPLAGKGDTLISLEYKAPGTADRALMQELGIYHSARTTEAADYDETAALVAELDVVVSVQTAVVHLAGALGKRCLVLVPEKPHWRYGMSGDSMPWYRSVKLLRQQGGNWPIDQANALIDDGAG